MATDYNPYYILDATTMSKVRKLLNMGKTMAEKMFPHLKAEYRRDMKEVLERTETFIGTQNKPKTTKAYKDTRLS